MIEILPDLFATHGTPITVVSNNGRSFISEEFETFLKMSAVKYRKLSAPYQPARNCQVERYVKTAKDSLRNEFFGTLKKSSSFSYWTATCTAVLGTNIRSRSRLTSRLM